MQKKDFIERFVLPVLTIFLAMTVSWIVYNLAWRIGNHFVHQLLAAVFGTLLFFSITFGALFIYPFAYFRGASLTERVAASLINPSLWAAKECFRLLTSFSVFESLYYFFNPLSLWLFCGIFAQIGFVEILCRIKLKKQGKEIKAMHPVAIAVFIISMFLVVFLYAWGQGENIYVIFLEWYRKFFGPGAGI